jgi:hypothetical protein
MKYLLVALLPMPAFSFADELPYDLDLVQIYRRSMSRTDRKPRREGNSRGNRI